MFGNFYSVYYMFVRNGVQFWVDYYLKILIKMISNMILFGVFFFFIVGFCCRFREYYYDGQSQECWQEEQNFVYFFIFYDYCIIGFEIIVVLFGFLGY